MSDFSLQVGPDNTVRHVQLFEPGPAEDPAVVPRRRAGALETELRGRAWIDSDERRAWERWAASRAKREFEPTVPAETSRCGAARSRP
ncbi:hypothetical protein [Nocardia sp. NPDC057440]|uniref:hypothetical protein n=1 Tax=Nocardia sp. NPDC057440 TaxID=3346134 RepID=UPI003672FF65